MPRFSAILLIVVGFCPIIPKLVVADDSNYRTEIEQFQKAREALLRAEEGWLSVSGLFWLKPGPNRVGSDPSSDVVLRGGTPRSVGILTLATDPGGAMFQATPGLNLLLNGKPFGGGTIQSDANGAKADVLAVGEIRLILLRRNDRFALRLKDTQAPTRTHFAGLRWYPVAEDWKVVGRLTPHRLPSTIAFETIVGGKDVMPSPGFVTFEHGGQSARLDAAQEPDGKLWFVFRDATSGKTTASNARQLTADAPEGDVVILDFNKAINLPCAYIEHATCPIAPMQNRLTIEVDAGEQLPRPSPGAESKNKAD